METSDRDIPERKSQKDPKDEASSRPLDARDAGEPRAEEPSHEELLAEEQTFEDSQQSPEMLALVDALVKLAPTLDSGHPGQRDDEWSEPATYLTPPGQSLGSSATRLSSAVGGCLDALLGNASLAAKASVVWHNVAGDIAAKHTRGLYYKEGAKGHAGVLYVYVDSPIFVYEFRTDHELYEQRMAYLGWSVDHIEFRLSRYPATPGAWGDPVPQKPRPLKLCPSLSPEQEQWCERLVKPLPDDLARAAYKALRSTLQRNMS